MKARRPCLAAILLAVVCLVSPGCDGPQTAIDTTAPPPPPTKTAQASQTYDFSQSMQHHEGSRLTRKIVIALVRWADDRPLDDTPYGSEPAGKPTAGENSTNVEVNVNTQGGAARPPSKQPLGMSARSREMLKHELMEAESFVLVERERILDILREQRFGQTEFVNPETSPGIGEVMAVQYLLEGSIGMNQDRTFKDTLDGERTYKDGEPTFSERVLNPSKASQRTRLRELTVRRLEVAKKRQMQRENSVGVYLSLYDVRTSQIVVESFGIGGNRLEAIRDAVEDLVDECLDLPNPVRIAAVNEDRVYLDVGEEDNVAVGQTFRYMTPGPVVRSSSGQVIGNQDEEGGELEIIRVEPLMSVARITRRVEDPVVGSPVLPLN